MRVAILIGIDEYRDAPLTGCVRDVRAYEHLFRAPHGGQFERVSVFTDEKAVRKSVCALLAFLSHKSVEQLIVVFSGHADANSLLFFDGALPYRELGRYIYQVNATYTTVILDACQSGGFKHTTIAGTVTAREHYLQLLREAFPGAVVMTATDRNSYATDTPEGGYFTNALIYGAVYTEPDLRGGGISVGAAFETCKSRLEGIVAPAPQISGPSWMQPFALSDKIYGFGSADLSRPDWYFDKYGDNLIFEWEVDIYNRSGLPTRIRHVVRTMRGTEIDSRRITVTPSSPEHSKLFRHRVNERFVNRYRHVKSEITVLDLAGDILEKETKVCVLE